MMSDFLDRQIGGSIYFKWNEALFLQKIGASVFPQNKDTIHNIIQAAMVMDRIRNMFGKPINITSWYRPQKYNDMIGGAKNSAHVLGLAVDFLVQDIDSDKAREIIKPFLKDFNIRMEALNTKHVHVDLKSMPTMSNESRYFLP